MSKKLFKINSANLNKCEELNFFLFHKLGKVGELISAFSFVA